MLFSVVLVTALSTCWGYGYFQTKIPNGERIPHPCKPNYIWHGVGHKNAEGGGVRNPFGKDFEANGKIWNEALCRKDSDDDGKTNGEELGDPNCTWKGTGVPEKTTGLSHPGVCEPTDDPKCAGKNQWEFCDNVELKCPQINHPDVMNMTIAMPKTKVPATETNYFCTTFDLPADDDYHVIGYKPLIDNRYVVHHIILFGCTGQGNISSSNYIPSPCGMQVRESGGGCRDFLAGWTLGSPGQCLKENVGLHFGKTGMKRVNMQIHWNNPQLKTDHMDGSGIVLYYTKRTRMYDASTFVVGQRYLELKPGLETIEQTGVCSSECTQANLKKPIYLMSVNFHMHYLGKSASLEHHRGGKKIKDVAVQSVFSYDSPLEYRLDPPVELRPGDKLMLRCGFQTLTSQKVIYYGDGTQDEMCFAFLLYYPKQGYTYCVDYKNISASMCKLKLLNNSCNDRKMQEAMVQMGKFIPKILSACDSTGQTCKLTCPKVLQEVRLHPCLRTSDLVNLMEEITFLYGQMTKVEEQYVKMAFQGMRSCDPKTTGNPLANTATALMASAYGVVLSTLAVLLAKL